MDTQQLQEENLQFADTNGVSANNHDKGFIPAFKDPATGRIEPARSRQGDVATMHLICGLPREWAAETDENGSVTCLKPGIIAGFIKDGQFFTRDQAIALCQG